MLAIVCNSLSLLQYYPDKAVRREIFQLIVLCSHSIDGCPWQGQLQHFEVGVNRILSYVVLCRCMKI